MVVVGWRNRVVDEGVKEDERTILLDFKEVEFGREGFVERYVSFATAAAATVREAMAV